MQALAVASPSLQAAISIWKINPDCKKGLQAERSLVRYLSRMAGRATPFGLFSGCSVGTVNPSAATSLRLGPRTQYRSATRLDFDYLFALTTELRRDAALQMEMRYGTNSSLYRIGRGWHYIESRLSGSTRSHHLVKVDGDDYLNSVLNCARAGNRSLADLAVALRSCDDSTDFTDFEIVEYLRQLIQSEILVPTILPVLTGQSPLNDLLGEIGKLPSARNVYEALDSVRHTLSDFDCRSIGRVSGEEYQSVAIRLEALPAKVEHARLLQVDMFKPVESANLGQVVLDEIYGTLETVRRFATTNEPANLVHFRNAFTERYERQWVPLLEALDLDTGIGYGRSSSSDGSPLLKGLNLTSPQASNGMSLNEFQTLLLQKVLNCSREGKRELVLSVSDLPAIKHPDDVLPESFAVVAVLISPSAESLQNGEFELLFKGGFGPSCANVLGRFCSADPELASLVGEALREEEAQDPDAVYAEVVYLPEGRIGNILCRPVLRDYEITHLGRSGAPPDRQIPTDDLLVTVRGTEILLYSNALHRRVIPRMSNAHSYDRADLSPVYRFLCDLQSQGGLQVPKFHWGSLAKLDALPRIRIGRIVLACAQWRITHAQSKLLHGLDRHAAFIKIKEMQRERGMPRWVLLSEYDNTLPVDLDNPLSVDSLLQLLKRATEATLTEMYPPPGSDCVVGPEGSYVHELVIPLARKRLTTQTDSRFSSGSHHLVKHVDSLANIPRVQRHIPPGNEWQFIKIYGGVSALDNVLIEELAPLLFSLCADGAISRWFFIRYTDPEPHLRLRFQTPDCGACPALTQRLDSLFTNNTVWKLQSDTYQREIERYGGFEALLLAEEVFCADSEAVVAVLASLEGDDGLDMRWRIVLLGIDAFLADSDFDLTQKLGLMDRLRKSFANEFQVSDAGKQQLGERFRKERPQLESIMRREFTADDTCYQVAVRAFALRSERIRPAISSLRALMEKGMLTNDYWDIIGSYIHMHVNRVIRASSRAHELVVYGFLYRLYDSQLSRDKESPLEHVLETM